jgi:uncharacterized cupredoxin-like copper-binding protein
MGTGEGRSRWAGVLAVLVAVGGLSACAGEGRAEAPPSPPRTIVLDIGYSKFSPSSIRVRQGESVRFLIHNRDPIPHELIVGDQATQDRHEHGTEPHHGERPGEVSVAAGASAETTVTFGSRGRLLFGCHLPGHWAYGMKGTIRVT